MKDILVIGGGPAGVQAALSAAQAGSHVTMISDGAPGGRAAWKTLLPSKMFLGARLPIDLPALRARYERVVGTWQRQLSEDLERAGVILRLGTAAFTAPHTVSVTPPEGGYPDSLTAEVIILATGAAPYFPPGFTPDGTCIFSPQMVWDMPNLPKTMIVIGAGAPATEYVDAFSRLGVQITWITGPVAALSAYPPDAGRFITGVLERRGVRVFAGLMARQVERLPMGVRVLTADGAVHDAEMAFIAIGQRPDFERLNVQVSGLKTGSSGGLATDPFGRTAIPHIYLVGDAASPISANVSIAQGRVAGWHAAGLAVEPARTDLAVMAIYTDPQIAMLGRVSDRGGVLQRVRVPFSACLRAHMLESLTEPQDAGFLEITYDSLRRITGALAVCPEASEILTLLALAIQAGLTIDELAAVNAAHPTFTELAVIAARMAK